MPTAAGDNSSPAEVLCHALVTVQDLPPGFGRFSTPASCDDDPRLQSTGFKGQNGGLEMIGEQLERDGSVEDATSRLPDFIAELNKLAPDSAEQDPAEFRDLGDEVHYFTSHHEQTYWNTLYIRRGKLLMYLSVTKYGPFPSTDMHLFASKAVKRTSPLG